nr:hypothetical protein [Tanacetum cinerariifolium]
MLGGLTTKGISSIATPSSDVVKQAKEVVDDITLVKALMEIKSAKPKANKVVIQEPEQAGINEVNVVGANTNNELSFDLEMPDLEDISTFNFSSNHEDNDEMADMNNLDTTIQVSPTPTIRIHKDPHIDQVIRDLHSTNIDANEDIYVVNVHNDEDMFGVNNLDGDDVIVESVDVVKQAKEVVDDITLVKALMEIKSAKPKANKVVIQEPEQG